MVGKDKVKIADVGSRARTAETWSLKKVIRQGKEGANEMGFILGDQCERREAGRTRLCKNKRC